METIFDKQTIDALVYRIRALTPQDTARWGKMDAFQMLRHGVLSEEMFLGKKKYDRLFIGRIFGKPALNGILKNADPLKKNQPTHPELRITGTGDFEAERQKWIARLYEYEKYRNPDFVHPFFGPMTKEQVGRYVYKHTDHHLRQFGQ